MNITSIVKMTTLVLLAFNFNEALYAQNNESFRSQILVNNESTPLEPVHSAFVRCTNNDDQVPRNITLYIHSDDTRSASNAFSSTVGGDDQGLQEYKAVIGYNDSLYNEEKTVSILFKNLNQDSSQSSGQGISWPNPNDRYIKDISAELVFRGTLKWKLSVDGKSGKGTLKRPVINAETGVTTLEPQDMTCKVPGSVNFFL